MLANSYSVEVRNIPSSKIWKDNLKVNRWDIIKYYNSLIDAGYTIFDAPASGLLDLSALANGNYVICWKTNDPTGDFSISSSTTKSGAHNVVILPVKLGAQNQIIQAHINPTINLAVTYNFSNKLTLAYGSFSIKQYPGGYSPESIVFDHCYLEGYYGDVNNFQFSFCELVIDDVGEPFHYGRVLYPNYSVDSDIVNCRFIWKGQPSGSHGMMIDLNGGKVQFINCEFIDQTEAQTPSLVVNALSAQTLNFQNTFFDGVSIGMSVYVSQDNGLPIYADNPQLSGSYVNNYFIIPAKWALNKYLKGYYHLETDEIKDRSSQETLDAIITQQRKSIRKSLGTIKRMYYNIQFREDYLVSDKLKYFDDEDLLLVYRTDIETLMVNDPSGARKIKNLSLYENDGTTPYNYRNGENFLILASDGTNDYVFGYYKDRLHFTVFTDAWENTLYTVTDVFHLLRTPTEVSIRNVWPTADSPMSGNVLYQDLTSNVIIP